MNPTQVFSLLALRRLLCRPAPAVAYANGRHSIDGVGESESIRRDPHATAAELQRAFQLAWLTIDLALLAGERDALQGATRSIVEALNDGPLESWTSRLGPVHRRVREELSAARRQGPLRHDSVDLADIDRQLARMRSAPEPQVLRELENYALGDLADHFRHAGFAHLADVVEPCADEEDSLLVGLVVSFLHLELDRSAETSFGDNPLGVLPPGLALRIRQESADLETSVAVPVAPQRFAPPNTEVEGRIRQGVHYAQRGDYERAIVEFSVVLQHAPANPIVYFHRGDAHRLKGDYERAVADYSVAIRLDPAYIPSYLGRGTAHRLSGAIDKAHADFSQAIGLDPKNVAARLSRGAAATLLGRDDAAVADFSEALRLDPSHAWAYQSRADVYAGKGEHDLALADYGQALRLNPYFPLAYSNRGDVYRLKGEFDQAVADYSEAMRLDQFNPRIYANRGDAYRQKGQYEQALADFGEAIRLDSTNPAGYLNRGITLQLAGEYDRAVADFDRAEQFDSANPTIYYQRALAYQQQSSFERALNDLGRAIELNPRDAVAYLCRGTIYAGMRNFPGAIEDFSEAIRLNPKSEQAYLDRGTVRAQAGEFRPALEDCGAALKLNPNLVPALLVRGGCQHRLGNHGLAVEEYNEAIRINPRYAKAYNDRGATLSKMGQLDEAVRDFSRAIELKSDYVQAISNRATAYQLLKRHDMALRDLTQAVTIDGKYAAAYCVQRGMAELARHRFDQALADCAVALQLDAANALAKSTQAEILRQREEHFDLEVGEPEAVAPTPRTAHDRRSRAAVNHAPAHPAKWATTDDTQEVVLEAGDLVEDDEEVGLTTDAPPTMEVVSRRASPTQVAEPIASEPEPAENTGDPEIVFNDLSTLVSSTEIALPDQTDVEFPPADPAAEEKAFAAADAERLRVEWAFKQKEIEDKAKKLREANEAAAKKQPKAKKSGPEDEEERAARLKNRRNYVIIAIGFLFLGYMIFPSLWKMIPTAKFPVFTPEKLMAEYAKDKNRADDKFAAKWISVRGKINIEPAGKPGEEDRYFIGERGAGDFRIEFLNGNPDRGFQNGQELTISGQAKRIKDGKVIVLDHAG